MHMRTDEFDLVLDECLDRLKRGEAVAACLEAHPGHAQRLAPLLRAATLASDSSTWEPSADATRQARARFSAAVAARAHERSVRERRRPSWFERLTARPLPLAAIASLSVIALTALLVVGPLAPEAAIPPSPPPDEPGGTTSPQPEATSQPSPTTTQEPVDPTSDPTPDATPVVAVADAGGNFAFYLSDAPNDIGDFSSLVITIESIDLKPQGGGHWVHITPTEMYSDLVQLQGDLAHELWRGQVPPGDYTMVFLNVSAIDAVLTTPGETPDVSLPSDTFHIATNFSVGQAEPTEFVFDITVHRTGAGGSQARYILSPQAGESGVGHTIQPFTPELPDEDNPGKHTGQEDSTSPAGQETPDIDRPHPSPGPGTNNGRSRSEDAGPA